MPTCFRSAAAAALLLAHSLTALERIERVEPAMGTLFRVTLYAESAEAAKNALDDAFAQARQLDETLSDYKPESELNRLCRSGRAQVSEDLYTALATAKDVARESRGAFDPTIGPLSRLWRESRSTRRLPTPAALQQARAGTGWKHLRLDPRPRMVTLERPNMQLDLGGIAKGFAADRMLATLARHGIKAALVAASGDLAIGDPPPGRSGWTVSLNSRETRTLARCGVSTSGHSEQSVDIGGVRYSHIVDPRTGLGLTGGFSVTVIAPSGILADSLATASVVLGPEGSKVLRRRWPNVQWIVHSGDER